MISPYGRAVVIVNGLAARKQFGGEFGLLRRQLDETGLEYTLKITEAAGHAVDLAAEAVAAGIMYLVAVGGDGTINEIVNGMLSRPEGRTGEIVLAVIPAGSGSDYVRTFGLPGKAEDAMKHLSGEAYFTVDAGRFIYASGGGHATRYFANIAEAGLGAEIARLAGRMPRFFGRWRYLLGFWSALVRFRLTAGTVTLEKRSYEGPITNVVVANAQFYGGGMRVAPKAHPADGKFDVLVMRGNRRAFIEGLTKVFKGNHLPSPAIREYMAAKVEVVTERPVPIECDGEVIGTTPARFEVVPNAFRLKI